MKILGKNFSKIFPFNTIFPEPNNFIISISRGCIHNCTYCVIRKAVGFLESKPIEYCINEFKQGLQQGFTTFVLEADDIGPYGTDIGKTLPELLQNIIDIDSRFSVIISHTHPFWIIKYASELKQIIKSGKIKGIFISIQSGNDRILKLIERPYPKEKLITTLLEFKKINSELEIGVDLMIGFPSETISEFHDTIDLLDKVQVDFGNIFPFSSHPGTKASMLTPSVPKNETNKRMKETLRFLIKNNYFAWRFRSTGFITFYKR